MRHFLSPVSRSVLSLAYPVCRHGAVVCSAASGSIWLTVFGFFPGFLAASSFLFNLTFFFSLHLLLLTDVIETLSLVFLHLPFSFAHQGSSNATFVTWLRVSSGTKVMAQWTKPLPSSLAAWVKSQRTHMVPGEDCFLQVVLWTSQCTL